MKFWKKLVLLVVAVISIILSCSRYYIVRNNFLNSIESSSKQNTNQHTLERYMLENKIVESIKQGEEITYEKIIEHIKSLYLSLEDYSELVVLYTENGEEIYSNIQNINELDVDQILNEENDEYCLRELNNKNYMFFSSHWSINNKIIYIVNAYDITSIYQEKDRQMRSILITDIILIVSSIVISIISILLTRPINKLNKISKKIASRKI